MNFNAKWITFAGLISVVIPNANSQGGAYWYPMTLSLCLIQDERYATLPMGKALANEESILRWKKSLSPAAKRCIKSSKPIPKDLCVELLSPEPGQRQDNGALDKLRERFPVDLQSTDYLHCERMK